MRCSRCNAELVSNGIERLCPVCLLDAALSDEPDKADTAFGYDLIEEIGRGGMGVVYRAVQHGSLRQVAVKMILAEQAATPGMLERFRAEAEAIASLDHPHILPIYETGEIDATPFYSMRLASGGTLRECVADFRAQPRRAAKLMATVARAVHHAHERGILHRDLKPGNILLDGPERTPFVSDFGLAKWLGRNNRLTLATSALGTPHYIAPEQAAGVSKELTPAADVYSLGAILYELLAGRPPFVADTPLETLRLAADTPPPAPRNFEATIPRDLELICLKCLAKEPSARYRSAAALAEDLERWLEGRTILARPSTPVERAWRWTKRNPVVAALSGTLLIVLLSFLIALFAYWPSEPASTIDPGLAEKSVAVLPFLDLSPAKDQEYFCDGISEEILDSLAKVEGLQVAARTSSFSFKGTNLGVKEIAEKLGVQHILEGSLRRDGNRIRVTAQLVNASDGFHLWSETYERELQGVFAVQDEITRAITGALKVKLAGARPAQKQNTEAHDLYLQGVFFSNKSTEEGLRKGLEFFQRSLEKDPNSARAWSGIAKTWNWLGDAYVRPSEAFPQMKAAAEKAIALDPDDTEAHIWLGESKRILDWDMDGFKAEINRALQLDPNSATAHCFMGLYEATHGNKDAAAMHVRESLRLDPLSPIISNFAALAYLCLGRLDEAIAEGKRTLQLDPNYIYETPILADAYREKGMFAEAIALFLKAQQITGAPQPGLAVTYARMGRTAEARQILADLKEVAAKKYIAAEEIAAVYAALGEKDQAFKWLEQACEDHGGAVQAVPIRPVFRSLHSDPRFWAIVRRFGLDPAVVLDREKTP
jgi:serine/threonine protein kinase/Tfp pilus assembly protein PilF